MTNVQNVNLRVDPKYQHLHIRNKLPQIILPKNKIPMFIEWWNEDVRFLKDVPRTFNEGYFIIENEILDDDLSKYKDIIIDNAKHYSKTYREIENILKEQIMSTRKFTAHFRFEDDKLKILNYNSNNELFSGMDIQLATPSMKNVEDMDPISPFDNFPKLHTLNDIQNELNKVVVDLLVTSLWYMATTTHKTSYYYEKTNKDYIESTKDKRVVQVKQHRCINTPIYDFNKIRKTTVKKLIQHRQGYTYSHSFQVQGHYRRYKDGKVVFVKSYVKGKNKEFRQQTITLQPTSIERS